jgi:hypothetical protein
LGESKEQGEQAERQRMGGWSTKAAATAALGYLPEKLAIIVEWKNVTFKAISGFEGH